MPPNFASDKVAVVGAGTMGTGIAHAFAVAGCSVMLIDTEARALELSLAKIRDVIDDGITRMKLTKTEGESAFARVSTHSDLARALINEKITLLVETASESMEIKKKIVAIADPLLPEDGLLATNTSALSVTELASVSMRPH